MHRAGDETQRHVEPDGTADDTAADPDAVTQTITPDGGTVTSADGLLTLTFPQGAVTEPVEISIGVAPPEEAIEGGDVTYELGPDGPAPVGATPVTWAGRTSTRRPTASGSVAPWPKP